jgi:hypothetical protein
VHYASFLSEQPAISVHDGLEKTGRDAVVAIEAVGDNRWYRVFLGPVKSVEEASRLLESHEYYYLTFLKQKDIRTTRSPMQKSER